MVAIMPTATRVAVSTRAVFYPMLQRYVLQPFHLMPHRFMLLK